MKINNTNHITTVSYYDGNFSDYIDKTHMIKMAYQQERFLSWIPKNGIILDVGFGSGRDMLAFSEKGYYVEGIDASSELTKIAKEKGLSVRCMSIQEWCDSLEGLPIENVTKTYDGIWACASILHLEEPDIYRFFHCVSKAMEKNGVIFVSVKNGITTGLDEQGRFFTNFTEELLGKICEDNPQLSLIDRWESDDGMGRDGFVWWNLIFRNMSDTEVRE